jgi:hypothetical protein
MLAALSFALFAFAVISLQQARTIRFVVEEAGPIPAALSHYLFGARGALMDSGLRNFFLKKLVVLPAEQAVERAVRSDGNLTHRLAPLDDGTGVGTVILVMAAFALFGLHAHALSYLFLSILGISTAMFMLRFQDKRIMAIPVLFSAFAALLLSPMAYLSIVAQQAPIGGIRSYAIVPIIAALHWCLEIAADSPIRRRDAVLRWALLGIQIGVLIFSILVRGSPIYLLGPVFAVGLYRLRRNRGQAGIRMMLLRVIVPTLALFVVLHSITPVFYREYARAGRASTIAWHRLFISFGLHPAWPFPGLREKYPCPDIPEGLVPVGSDRSGECIWWTYIRAHNLSTDHGHEAINSDEYDAVLRSAVWYVIRTYPKEAFDLFFYIKPKLIVTNELAMLSLRAPRGQLLFWVVLAFQCAILIAFMIDWPLDRVFADIAYGAGMLSPFLLFGLVPQIIAWPAPHTAIDFNAYVSCALILSLWLFVAVAIKLLAGRANFWLQPAGPEPQAGVIASGS